LIALSASIATSNLTKRRPWKHYLRTLSIQLSAHGITGENRDRRDVEGAFEGEGGGEKRPWTIKRDTRARFSWL